MHSCLVLGAGRSGTAMIAGTIAGAGYHTARASDAGFPRNPRGFHESPEVNEINNELIARALGSHGEGWLRLVPLDATFEASPDLGARMQRAVAERPFCLKDPRFCVTLPAWRRCLGDVRFVVVFRHPAATAASTLEGVRTPAGDGQERDLEWALRLWSCQYRHILDRHRHEGRWLFLHYDQVCLGDGLDRLSAFLEADVDRTFIDRTLRREPLSMAIGREAEVVYGQLCRLAGFTDDEPAQTPRSAEVEVSLLAVVEPGDQDLVPQLVEDLQAQRGRLRCELVLVDQTGLGISSEGASVTAAPMASREEALLAGLGRCRGSFIALAVPGCRSAPNRAARAVEALRDNASAEVVLTDGWVLGLGDSPIGSARLLPEVGSPPRHGMAGFFFRREALARLLHRVCRAAPAESIEQALVGLLRDSPSWLRIEEPLFWLPVQEAVVGLASRPDLSEKANRPAPQTAPPRPERRAPRASSEGDIGAFYQCYHQSKAVIRCLQAFREVYPDTDVVLVSDGGADHRGIARHFGCSYKHEERIGNGYNLASFSFERGLAYLLRFFSAIHGIRQHWVMLLEDDVRVERAVETSQLRHTVNGCRTDMGVPLPLALALRNHGSAVSLPVQPMSFFGGTIFDRGFFLRVGPEAMVSAFAELFPVLERTNPFWTQDSVLTAITLRLGGTVGSWPGYSQVHWPWYPFHRLFGTIEVLHGYKAWYGRPLSDPERALLDGHSVAALPPDQDDLLEHHLAALERICCQAYVQHGQIPEGSLFTRDFVRDPRLVEKQSNLRALLDRPRRYLETGFNSGQSALLVLSAHEENSILSFDIGRRAYERPCAAYLGQAFPGRLEVVWGDSRQSLPTRLAGEPCGSFDLIHIDGGHDYATARSDLVSCRAVAGPDTQVLVDDVQQESVRSAMEGLIEPLPGWPREGSPCPQVLGRYLPERRS